MEIAYFIDAVNPIEDSIVLDSLLIGFVLMISLLLVTLLTVSRVLTKKQ